SSGSARTPRARRAEFDSPALIGVHSARLFRMIPKNIAVAATLRARGLRLTRQRRIILEVVHATDAHPTAAFVYRRVRRRLPHVSLATVYRNLRRLAAEGFLAARADPAGGRFGGNPAPADRFTCVDCGRLHGVATWATRGEG